MSFFVFRNFNILNIQGCHYFDYCLSHYFIHDLYSSVFGKVSALNHYFVLSIKRYYLYIFAFFNSELFVNFKTGNIPFTFLLTFIELKLFLTFTVLFDFGTYVFLIPFSIPLSAYQNYFPKKS